MGGDTHEGPAEQERGTAGATGARDPSSPLANSFSESLSDSEGQPDEAATDSDSVNADGVGNRATVPPQFEVRTKKRRRLSGSSVESQASRPKFPTPPVVGTPGDAPLAHGVRVPKSKKDFFFDTAFCWFATHWPEIPRDEVLKLSEEKVFSHPFSGREILFPLSPFSQRRLCVCCHAVE